jgi:hypothetical protein
MKKLVPLFAVCLLLSLSFNVHADTSGLSVGDIELKSIGPIAFGPDQVLFISDPKDASVYAVSMKDTTVAKDTDFELTGVDTKLAAMIGVKSTDVLLTDLALDTKTNRIYLSASRGRGPDALPLLVSVTAGGSINIVDLKGVSHSKVSLWSLPGADGRGRNRQMDAITEIAFADDHVIVAGLSNEEFSSRLRVIPFPFGKVHNETGIEIFHTAHGRWETHSPIRAFTTYTLQDDLQLLAAHTCTPLVTMPVKKITSAESKLVGDTIAELGNRNRPLDMLVYTKEGDDFLLITNSSRGVMKLAMDAMGKQEKMTERVQGTAGVPADTIAAFEGVQQVEPWGDDQAIALRKNADGTHSLATLTLP